MDTELFKLCKSVYEKTGWDRTESFWASNDLESKPETYEIISIHHKHYPTGFIKQEFIPAYTSDYLLEKLPSTNNDGVHANFGVSMLLASNPKRWGSSWDCDTGDYEIQQANTPLKALLKLTLALHEAGELLTNKGEE